MTAKGSETRELDEYFVWLCELVGNRPEYSMLLRELFNTPFFVVLPMDENRVDDGLSLRYRYSIARGLSAQDRLNLKRLHPCSILEVMVSLAVRSEEEYMRAGEDNTTGKWFWYMVSSLGLQGMIDVVYDSSIVQEVLRKMMVRDYSPDGAGSLFYIPGCKEDLRVIEIWYQCMTFLNSYIYGGN